MEDRHCSCHSVAESAILYKAHHSYIHPHIWFATLQDQSMDKAIREGRLNEVKEILCRGDYNVNEVSKVVDLSIIN